MAELGLNEQHQGCLSSYLKFCKFQRSQRLRSVEACFKDLKDSSLMEETYTVEEVEQLLENLKEIVKTEVEGELLHETHCNSLVIASLCQQAQKWHLNLQLETANLENKQLLEAVSSFEESFGTTGSISSPIKKSQLAPLSDSEGPNQLLHAEIARLDSQNKSLMEQLHSTKDQLNELLKENISVKEDIRLKEIELNYLNQTVQSRPTQNEVSELSDEVEQMRMELTNKELDSGKLQEKLNQDLISTQDHLIQVKAQLELAEKELEAKFSQTTVYQNLRKLLTKKNEKIKEQYMKLKQYEREVDSIE